MSDTPLDFEQLVATITVETYQNLKRAIELGKWPDGRRLTTAQQENTLQLIIAYEHRFLPEESRVGYIDRGDKEEGESCSGHSNSGHSHEAQPVQIK